MNMTPTPMAGRPGTGRGGSMNKTDLSTLILKHDCEISELKTSTAQMLMLWKAVGAFALVCLGAWLTVQLGGAA